MTAKNKDHEPAATNVSSYLYVRTASGKGLAGPVGWLEKRECSTCSRSRTEKDLKLKEKENFDKDNRLYFLKE